MNDVTQSENIKITQKIYEAILAGDLQSMASFFDNDFVAREPASLPYGGEYYGLTEFERMLADIMTYWKCFEMTMTNFTAGDNLVTAHFNFSGYPGASRKSLVFPVVEIWRFSGGLVQSLDVFVWDTFHIIKEASLP